MDEENQPHWVPGEQELLEKLSKNVDDYFHLLVYKYSLYIFKYINDDFPCFYQEAQDITQETFINAYLWLSTLSVKEDIRQYHLSGWLKTIARNICLNKLRKRGRQPPPNSLDDREVKNFLDIMSDDSDYSVEGIIEGEERKRKLYNLLKHLPPAQLEAIYLHYINELSIPEIAKQLDISANTIKSRIKRGMKQIKVLAQKMAESQEGE